MEMRLNSQHRDHVEELKERPVGELIKELSNQTTTLIRQEFELAKAELSEKGKEYGKAGGMFGAAGIVGFLALGAFTTCLIAALATGMPTWLAALIVTIVYAAIAGVLAMTGKQKTEEAAPPVPEQTVQTLKEDVAWAKTQTQSARR